MYGLWFFLAFPNESEISDDTIFTTNHHPLTSKRQNSLAESEDREITIIDLDAPKHSLKLTEHETSLQSVKKTLDKLAMAIPDIDTITAPEEQDFTHSTPRGLLDAAAIIGEVRNLAKNHPEAGNEFAIFFENCMDSDDLASVTRALCLQSFINNKTTLQRDHEAALHRLPLLVVRLYKAL